MFVSPLRYLAMTVLYVRDHLKFQKRNLRQVYKQEGSFDTENVYKDLTQHGFFLHTTAYFLEGIEIEIEIEIENVVRFQLIIK